jgi:hypothetical protein
MSFLLRLGQFLHQLLLVGLVDAVEFIFFLCILTAFLPLLVNSLLLDLLVLLSMDLSLLLRNKFLISLLENLLYFFLGFFFISLSYLNL